MPHNKHGKNSRPVLQRADTNNNINVNENNNGAPAGAQRNGGPQMFTCCVPMICAMAEEVIDPHQPGNAVRVHCNNDQCTVGNWMHKSCFDEWEQTVLSYLRSCGRARSWSEKQRLQNLWTKKGYDLAFKACDCKCGRGHLRKDLDYFPTTPVVDNAVAKKKKKKPQTPNPAPKTGEKTPTPNNSVKNGHHLGVNANANHSGGNADHGRGNKTNDNVMNVNGHQSNVTNGNVQGSQNITIINNNRNLNENGSGSGRGHPSLRLRTDSVSSTGSSPPDSASSFTSGSGSPVPPPLSPLNVNVVRPVTRPKFDFVTPPEQNQNVNGTIFRRRHDLSAFDVLPKHKQNPYHIKMEDDIGPSGNDDTKNFVLSHLNSYRVHSLKCVLCKNDLPIFDRYPLIDGTFFLSPQAYDEGVVQVISDGRLQFINAVCVDCLEGGKDIRCAACKRKWDGSALLLGSMYSYDIFAAMPCCQKRLTCKHCRRAVVDVNSGLPYYSEYSHMITCPYCKAYDYHFIRPLNETFSVKHQNAGSIWN